MRDNKKWALQQAQELLSNVTDENRKTSLNSLFGLFPAHFTTAADQQQIRSQFPPGDADLSLYALNLMRLYRRREAGKLIICCMPKSGSTYLMTSLTRVKSLAVNIRYIHTPYENPTFVNADQRENELDELGLLRAEMMPGNFVTQAHLKSSVYTDRTLRCLGYKIIVVQRNIFDCLVSMDDMICNKEMPGFAMFRPPKHYLQMDRADRLDLITRYVGPWYVDFAVSWARTALKPLHVSYEQDILGFSEDTARKIQSFLNAPQASLKEICQAFQLKDDKRKELARLNKAVAGRGRDIPKAARQAILDLAKPYEEEVRFFEKGLL